MSEPASLSVAKLFMAEGRQGTRDHSDSYPIEACSPNVMIEQQIGNFNLDGRTPNHTPGVDYEMMPLRLNPNSVSDQKPTQRADGDPITSLEK